MGNERDLLTEIHTDVGWIKNRMVSGDAKMADHETRLQDVEKMAHSVLPCAQARRRIYNMIWGMMVTMLVATLGIVAALLSR